VRYYLRIIRSLPERAVFLLHKGRSFRTRGTPSSPSRESRARRDRGAQLPAWRASSGRSGDVGESVRVPLRIKNTGSLTWLHDNILDYALVKVGGHLLRPDGSTVDNDFLRSRLSEDVPPGGELSHELAFTLPAPGATPWSRPALRTDRLVEALGATPARLSLVVD